GSGVSLQGFLDDLRIESAGLAATIDFDVDGAWDGKKLGAGKGYASVFFRGASPGLPVDGVVNIGLTGDGILRFDAQELAIGSSIARWQGPLTLGTWEPAWAIDAQPAVFDEIGPLVNSWVGSTILPHELSGTGEVQINLSGPFKDLVVNVRVEAAPMTLAPVELDRLEAEATIGGSRLHLGMARFQIGDGFGEIDGGLAWGDAAGEEQLDLRIRGRHIPLESIASWIDLEPWVDSGSVSFTGNLTGPFSLPRGSWAIELEDLGMAGLEIGNASTSINLADARFACHDLSCDRGLEGDLWWDVGAAEVGGTLSWPQMPLTVLGEEISQLAGDAADVRLDFSLPQAGRPTGHLHASSDNARLEIAAEPETVVVTAALYGAVVASANLEREHDGALHGSGNLVLNSAGELIALLAPDSGVPLTGNGSATFQVDWRDERWPQLTGRFESMDLELEEQPVHLIEPADFVLGPQGFTVPGIRLRARNDDLFVRWTVDTDGQLSGNLSGTMDTLLLRFMLPDWEPAGRATGIVEFLGTTDDPLFEGIAEIEKGSFRLPGTRTILSQVNGTVLLSSGDVLLEGMDFRFMGGRGRAGGRIRESDENIVLSLAGTASGIRFEVLPDLDARLSGTWRLNGPVDDLNLSGDLVVDRMNLTTKDDLATMLLSWIGSTGQSAAEGGLSLNLHVDAEETIDLRSPFVRLKGSAGLTLMLCIVLA
ncbi:MAG: translocation/assembly module TamB domain-containing protein, partial [Acidobacteria bacterium]|nr:translocation/assembly module TamB domain-containing protein [Candidatus Sulfomarinibacter sp. MAG AM1]